MNLDNSSCYIIAEMSANHGNGVEIALETVRAAKRAGANAIKLQTYLPGTITLNSRKPDFLIEGSIWNGKYLYDLYEEGSLPWEWHDAIFSEAKKVGIDCFSSPFDISSVDFLEKFNVPAYKIASFEITDIPLIEYVARKGKIVIISTGIATFDDIENAILACKKVGNSKIVLLKCTSSYPAPIEEANLNMINFFKNKFNVTVGLSDHTIGEISPIVATALGAKFIEKHFILDRSIGGPDASFSLNENEFRSMVNAIRQTEKSLGSYEYELSPLQYDGRRYARSLYICEDVKAGDIVSNLNVRSVRPGYGLHPKHFAEILGRKFNQDLEKGDRVSWSVFE
jgi:pseudaminic acid synthase